MTYESELEEIEHKNQMVALICDHIINWNGVGVCAQPLQGIKEVYRNATTSKVVVSEKYYTLDKLKQLIEIGDFGLPLEQTQYYVKAICPTGIVSIRPMLSCVDLWIEKDGRAWVEVHIPFPPTPNAFFSGALRWAFKQIIATLA